MTANLHVPLSAEALQTGGPLRRAGRRVICLDETGSTNDDAFALAAREGSAADGTAVFAERQTSGRGRLGRTWVSPRGASVHCSLLLFEPQIGTSPGHVALAGGLSACRAIESATELRPQVRWPNDLFLGGRKLGGVLVERRAPSLPPLQRGGKGGVDAGGDQALSATVIGIGINCLQQPAHFPPDLRGRATSLEIESAIAVDRISVARQLLAALDDWFAQRGMLNVERLIREWRQRSDDLGTRVTIAANGRRLTGRILDVEPDAGLLFQTDDGARLHFDAATATIVERHG